MKSYCTPFVEFLFAAQEDLLTASPTSGMELLPDGDGDLRNSRSERERAVVGSGSETADQNGAQRKEYRQEDLLP